MKFFSISLLIIMLLPLAIQAAPLAPKAVLFMDRQRIYQSDKLKAFADERKKIDDDRSAKMSSLNAPSAPGAPRAPKTKAELDADRIKMTQFSQAHADATQDLNNRYNTQAAKVMTEAKKIMEAKDACAVIDSSGGNQIVNPAFDITQEVIDAL